MLTAYDDSYFIFVTLCASLSNSCITKNRKPARLFTVVGGEDTEFQRKLIISYENLTPISNKTCIASGNLISVLPNLIPDRFYNLSGLSKISKF